MNANVQEHAFLKPREVAELLRVNEKLVYAMLNSGELRGLRLGRSWRIPRSAVLEFLPQGHVVPLGGSDGGETR